MLDIFPVIRFSRSVVALLTVAHFTCAGCQCLSPKVSPPPQPPPMPMFQSPIIEGSEREERFRPIWSDTYVPPMPTPEWRSEPPKVESSSDTAAQSTINELRKTVADLHQTVDDLQTQLAEAQKVPPPLSESPPPKKLPIINKPGVHVYLDAVQNVRIAVTDDTLFVPNVWQLSIDGEEALRAITAEINVYDPKAMVDIEGHTDSLMGDPNNSMQKHEIASAKTAVVMDFFVHALRWDVARLGTSSYGRSRPVADNGTPEGRAKNNRIEIVLRSDVD